MFIIKLNIKNVLNTCEGLSQRYRWKGMRISLHLLCVERGSSCNVLGKAMDFLQPRPQASIQAYLPPSSSHILEILRGHQLSHKWISIDLSYTTLNELD